MQNEQFTRKILINRNQPPIAELKTKKNEADVTGFINSFADTEQKRKDSFELMKTTVDYLQKKHGK